MRTLLPLPLLLLGCQDAGLQTSNARPTAEITVPRAGSPLTEGVEVALIGVVGDADHGPDELRATWWVGDQVACEGAAPASDGTTTCTTTLERGAHLLVLEVRDPTGQSETDERELTVSPNAAPVATLLRPVDGSAVEAGAPLLFEGLVSDAEDPTDKLTVRWLSDRDGVLDSQAADADGLVTASAGLTAGLHLLALEVTDTQGRVGRASAEVEVRPVDDPPSCAVTEPLNGSTVLQGAMVSLIVTAEDPETRHDGLTVVWTSDLQGELSRPTVGSDHTARTTLTDLQPGVHQLTVVVRDDLGQHCTDRVMLTVDAAPTVLIATPASGAVLASGSAVALSGAVDDAEDAPAALTLTLGSDRDGPLTVSPVGTDGTFTAPLHALTPGDHLLTVTVADSAGHVATATTAVRIDLPPTAPALSVSPASPRTADDLVAEVIGASVDPEGDPITSTWSWTRDGQPSGHLGPFVPASATRKGETWTVSLTPADPWFTGPSGSRTVVIANTPPVVLSVQVLPGSPRVADDLTCAWHGLADADADAVSTTVSWYAGSSWLGDGNPLSTDGLVRGETVHCVVTPHDGTEAGDPVASTSVSLANRPPQVSAARITPEPLRTGDTAHCTAVDYLDIDGDPDRSLRAWWVDGVRVGEGAVLPVLVVVDQVVRCELQAFDGLGTGPTVSAEVVVANTPPTASAIEVLPAAPTASSTLTCALLGFSDADSDGDASTYGWTVDGQPAGAGPTLGLPLLRGQRVRCNGTPHDGREAGPALIAEVVVGNTPPTALSARIEPPQPAIDDDLTCTVLGSGDLDGDDVEHDIAWWRDGSVIAYGPTLPAGALPRGAEVSCTATPYDGTSFGAPVSSEPVSIGNSAPTVAGASLNPDPPRAGDLLICDPVGFQDADGDSDLSTRAWRRNGQPAGGGRVFPGTLTRGDTLTCELVPFDGLESGSPVQVSTLVANTPPTAAAVSLTPLTPHASDSLTCRLLNYEDADSDPDQTTLRWTLNGQPVQSGVSLTLPLTRDDVVTCTARPFDGFDEGEELSATVVVSNAAPVLASVDVLPARPTSTDDLLCLPGLVTDADGDLTSVVTAWEVDGVLVASTATLPAGSAPRGSSVRCLATPRDPFEDGLTLASTPVLIANAPPSVIAAVLTPDPAFAADTLTCSSLGYADQDGDPERSTVAWWVDGLPVGAGPTLPVDASRGQRVRCELTAYDGREPGNTVSAEVVIANTPPTATTARITPPAPIRDDVLVCALEGWYDADGDADLSQFTWLRQGLPVGFGPTLTGPFARGERYTCAVQVHDGRDPGPLLTAETTILNAPPELLAASLAPDPLFTEDTAVVTATPFDVDGDAVIVRYQWSVDGQPVGSTTASLSGTYFSKGQSVTVTLTPDDGRDTGPAVVVGPIIVANSPPRDLIVRIEPEDPLPWTPLQCVITTPAFDPDGDAVTYDASWIGPRGQVATATMTHPDDTVPGHLVEHGPWRCELRPTDADGLAGAPAVATTEVEGLWPQQLVSLGDADVQIYGEGLSDHLGDGSCPLATPDLDGDGRPDLVLGVAELNLAAGNDAGGVRIFFGAGLAPGAPIPLSSADVYINGDQATGQLGHCVANAGDLDGDGKDELIVGGPRYDGPTLNTGRIWLFRGSDLAQGATLAPASAWRTWTGVEPQSEAGYAVAGGVDVDGAGLPDLLIGAPHTTVSGNGAVYLLRGEALPASGPLSTAATWTLTAAQVADRAGHQVALADLTGDGLADLLITAPQATTGAILAGAVHLFDATDLPPAGGSLNLAIARWRITSTGSDDGLGARLSVADLDGDGLHDLLLGGPDLDPNGTDSGGAFLVHGADLPGGGDVPLLDARTQVLGVAAGDFTGRGLSLLPDLDLDGLPELLVGAPQRDLPLGDTGDAALFTSRRMSWISSFAFDEADHLFRGEDRLDRAGQHVHGADFDGDLRGDLIISAPYENAFWPSAGSVYIFFGP